MTMKNKNFSKTRIASIFGVIALIVGVSLFLTDCDDDLPEKHITGTITANEDGTVSFMYSRNNPNYPEYCSFTTNLPAPDNVFILHLSEGATTGKREIEGLEPGQKVEWTATVEGNPHDHGSGNFVHVVNN